jgi:AcrR family transcriptional regulator
MVLLDESEDVDDTDKQGTKGDILDATRQALVEYGYTDCSMAKVAAEFEGSQSLIHYHFDSKEGLFVAFLEREQERYDARFRSMSDDPGPRLDELIDMLVRNFDEWAEGGIGSGYKEMYSAAPHSDRIAEQLRQLDDRFKQAFVEVIEDGIEANVFREVDPEAIGRLLFAAHDSASERWIVGQGQECEAIADALEEYVLSEVRRRPEPP